MDDQFQDILDSLPERLRGRSRLEPYHELIDELRRRGRTYRDVANILRESCHLQVSASTIHDFVRIRSRWRKKSRGSSADRTASVKPAGARRNQRTNSSTKASGEEVRRRIAALKLEKAAEIQPVPERFEFNPDEPLRLRKPSPEKHDE